MAGRGFSGSRPGATVSWEISGKHPAESRAYLCDPCSLSMSEMLANAEPPSEPKSRKELIDHAWRKAWSEAFAENNFERDARWASAISNRSAGLHDGWIAVVVGWTHADPSAGDQRLRALLLSQGFSVNSVRLEP